MASSDILSDPIYFLDRFANEDQEERDLMDAAEAFERGGPIDPETYLACLRKGYLRDA